MTITKPSYSFFPWLRQGIANNIANPENDPDVKVRAHIQVLFNLKSQMIGGGEQVDTITRPVELYGPGDIIGIENRAIIRTDPHNWITDFETNYLPSIEFYDEDFPWRYTPAAPDTGKHRLRPWIMLIVLKEDEFKDSPAGSDKPLASIVISKPAADTLPRPDQLWAWAHVHVNRSMTGSDTEIVSNDSNAALTRLQSTLTENPDLAYSRIVCPRKLDENAAYHAFLVPAFESGRLSGLGQDIPAELLANKYAWEQASANIELPVYFRWFFRTGGIGDFEYLVRLLQPKPVDARVGTRDMDVQTPGPNLPGITDPELGGILKLGGALRVPDVSLSPEELDKAKKYDQWDKIYPTDFQSALAAFVNLADSYSDKTPEAAHTDAENQGVVIVSDPDDPDDPLITPPLYGATQSLTQRLLKSTPATQNANWVHNLNLDPRYRVAAGFGTYVIQDKQEDYMEAAWSQVGDVLEANRNIRWAQLSREVSLMWYSRHLLPLYSSQVERAMAITAPLNRRVIFQGSTVQHQLTQSVLPPSLLGSAMRRAIRPQGRLMGRLNFTADIQPGNILRRINNLEIPAVPPKITPPGLLTTDAIADKTQSGIPAFWADLLRRYPWLPTSIVILMVLTSVLTLLLAFTIICIPIGAAILFGLYQFYQRLKSWGQIIKVTEELRPKNQTLAAVDNLPKSPDFVLSKPGDPFRPGLGASDSLEAQHFKEALRDTNSLYEVSIPAGLEPLRKQLDLAAIHLQTLATIHPNRVIPLRTLNSLVIPQYLQDGMQLSLGQYFQELLAYPKIDVPMYKPLVDISKELFLPNIQLIEQNSITLLETNQRFIEAYMVGVNHEFAREILWREYPSTLRGTYFRQFWDVTPFFQGIRADDPQREQKLKDLHEKLYDIPPIHQWSLDSKIGDHDNREQGGSKEDEVVLVIRGELLKKYPTAVIYAHRAKWQLKDGKIDNAQERVLDPDFDLLGEDPPRDKIKSPLYEAKVDPDIYFFGFDLTAEIAIGGSGENQNDDPGWFFVIKERPGEPRFGLDIDQDPAGPPAVLNVWNDLSWRHVAPDAGFIEISNTFTLVNPHGNASLEEKFDQYDDDINHGQALKVGWNPNTNAADLAYILYQSPVMVAIHASEMLRKK